MFKFALYVSEYPFLVSSHPLHSLITCNDYVIFDKYDAKM